MFSFNEVVSSLLDVQLEVMQQAVKAKFAQNKKLRKRLLATGDAELIEDSRNDYVWGIGEDKQVKIILAIF